MFHLDMSLKRVCPRGGVVALVTGKAGTARLVSELPVLLKLLRHQRGVLAQVAGELFSTV